MFLSPLNIFACNMLMAISAYFLRKKKKYLSLLNSIVFLLGYLPYIYICVFRKISFGIGGKDASVYRRIFMSASDTTLLEYLMNQREEVLFLLLMWLVKTFFDDFRIFLFIEHTICYCSFIFFLSNYKIKKGGIINFSVCFLTMSLCINALNIQRTIFAMGIVLFSFGLYKKKKYKRAVVGLLISPLLHKSALIAILATSITVIYSKLSFKKYIKLPVFVCMLAFIELFLFHFGRTLIVGEIYSTYDNSGGLAVGTYIATFAFYLLLNINSNDFFFPEYREIKYILLSMIFCIPLQLYYTIAYRMVLMYMPFVYISLISIRDIYAYNHGEKFSIRNVSANVLVIFYIIYRIYQIYFIEFVADGIYGG